MAYSNARPRMAVAAVAGLQTEQIFLTPVEGSGFDLALPPGVRDWEGSIWDYYRQLYPSLASQPPDEAAVQAWEEPAPEPPPPLTDVEIAIRQAASNFEQARLAAPKALDRLKGTIHTALVGGGMSSDEATAAGVGLVLLHGPLLAAFEAAGGHPVAAAALYQGIASKPSTDALPWLTKEILEVFAAFLVPK